MEHRPGFQEMMDGMRKGKTRIIKISLINSKLLRRNKNANRVN